MDRVTADEEEDIYQLLFQLPLETNDYAIAKCTDCMGLLNTVPYIVGIIK